MRVVGIRLGGTNSEQLKDRTMCLTLPTRSHLTPTLYQHHHDGVRIAASVLDMFRRMKRKSIKLVQDSLLRGRLQEATERAETRA